MNRKYEALLALNTRGREESAKDIIDRIEKEFIAEGAKVEQVQRLEKRELAYEHKHMSSAYFVNFVFEADPALIDRLKSKFKLDADIMLQNYLVLSAPGKPAEAAA